MKIFTRANVPDELGKAWLQHLRDFDAAHPGCHFEVMSDAQDLSMEQMIAMVSVDPSLTFQTMLQRRDGSMNDLLEVLNMGHCPDCKLGGWPFEDGPRGGLSQNIACRQCGSKFNVAPRYPDGRRDIPLFWAERL